MKWTVIDGDVYDITNYIKMHPGGVKKINLGVGKESSDMFHKYHRGIKLELTPLPLLKIGELFTKQKDNSQRNKELKVEQSSASPSLGNFLSIPNIKLSTL